MKDQMLTPAECQPAIKAFIGELWREFDRNRHAYAEQQDARGA